MRKDLYLFDHNKKLLKIVNTESTNDVIVYDDIYTSDLSTGAETYTASFKLSYELQPLFVEGNYIGFYWQDKFKLMQIKQTESLEKIDDVTITCYAEFIGIELYNSYVSDLMLDGTVSTILAQLLLDTNYEIGYVSPALDRESFRCDVTDITSVYSVIQSLTSVFHECEWEFGVAIVNTIQGKYKFTINCYGNGERGTKRYNRYEGNRNVYGMKRMGDITNFCSGIIPVGANGITITDVTWDTEHGAPLHKPAGQNYLFDPEAHALLNNGGKHILMKYKSDATDPYSLMWDGYYKLKELNQTKFSYEIPVHLTDEQYENIDIGDTNYVINNKFNPPIQLEARISKFEISFTDRSQNKITLANFKEIKSKIKNLTAADIINETLGILKGKTGPLTQADIMTLQQYLSMLDIQGSTVEAMLKNLLNQIGDKVIIGNDPTKAPEDDDLDIEYVEDKENYKTIKIDKIDNGLLLGDKRIYDIKKQGVANITVQTTDTVITETSSSKVAQQYADAVAYYSNFSLGKSKSHSTLATIMSDSNKYKIGVIVRYWCGKFGIDPRLVYAMICAESSGNPYSATKSSTGGYGLMQCERSCYFNKNQTIKFVDGTTRSFTPSYNTMNPDKGITITLNGVKVNQNISNQIMFGCHELRKCAEDNHYNVFATLMAYNFGQGGVYWCVTHYIKDKYAIAYYGGDSYRGLSKQSTAMKNKYYEVLDTYKAPFASYRQKYKNQFKEGTVTNIEGYLCWYKPDNGSLPYFTDKKGNKLGYGVIVPSGGIEESEEPGSQIRDIIVAMAKTIVSEHVDKKIATYNQNPRTVDHTKPKIWSGTHYGIRNPIAYDCSSFVSCCYKAAGLTSVYNKSCAAGTLITSATSKSGYKMWKVDTAGIKNAIPGDIVMDANFKITSSNLTASNMSKVSKTHHTMIYIGDGKVAHASKWAYHPDSIRISNISYYQNKGTAFFLRPWDLAEADKKVSTSTGNSDETVIDTKVPVKIDTVSEVTVKGTEGAIAGDYVDLPNDITINNIEDNIKFPNTVPFVFCHFGIDDLDAQSYVNLLKALQVKYPKTPIFVAKEYYPNSSYTGTSTIDDIDTYNAKLLNYCNNTQYVIFLDISNGLVDSNGCILSDLSSDGYSFNSKSSVQSYYNNIKNYILEIAVGQMVKSSSTSVTLTAQTQKIHQYSQPIKSLVLKLPTTVEDEFYSRITFTTDVDSIKFQQPATLYLQGDNCKNGAFTPSKANKYVINIFKNADENLTNKKYYGSVTSMYTSQVVKQTGQVNCSVSLNVRKGAGTNYAILGKLKNNTTVTIISKTSNNWYKINYNNGYGYVSGKYIDNIKDVTDTTTNFTDYANFKYSDTLVKNAESFLANKSNFVYNNTCAFDYGNPSENIDKWMTADKYHIDDNFLIQLLVMGYSYDTSDLVNQTSRKKAVDVSWALPYISSEAKLLRYFVEQGWILDDVDYVDYTNIEPGDILFYDSDAINNNEFMACSHASICVGKIDGVNYMIEARNNEDGTAIRKITIKTRSATNLLCVGRINLSK